ncbi:GroES-like protein [Nemania abortiva]|nr:GroES-like protein [Nemania abortiva]
MKPEEFLLPRKGLNHGVSNMYISSLNTYAAWVIAEQEMDERCQLSPLHHSKLFYHGEVVFEDRPRPIIKDQHDAIVHVSQTGIYGSDYILNGPMVLGHEPSGIVAGVGSGVKNLKPGDRIAMEPGVPCRRCDYCRGGSYNLCGGMVFVATPPWDGTLAQYYVNTSNFCYTIPDSMNMEEAAVVEPLSKAVILGCGPIGILCQAVAKSAGARKVVGVDVVQYRLEIAKSYGVDGIYMPERAAPGVDPMAHVEKMTNDIKDNMGVGDGADVVLECSGAEPCIQMGVYVARRGSIGYLTDYYPVAIDLMSSGKIEFEQA